MTFSDILVVPQGDGYGGDREPTVIYRSPEHTRNYTRQPWNLFVYVVEVGDIPRGRESVVPVSLGDR